MTPLDRPDDFATRRKHLQWLQSSSLAIYGAGLQWSRGDLGGPPEDVAEQTLALISHGLYSKPEVNGDRPNHRQDLH